MGESLEFDEEQLYREENADEDSLRHMRGGKVNCPVCGRLNMIFNRCIHCGNKC